MSATSFDMPATGTQGWSGKENQVFPRFYRGQLIDHEASKAAGAPVHKSADMVTIYQAGEKDNQIEVVNELHKRRWPQHWAQYQQGVEQMESGTPLAILFPTNPALVADLARYNVHTVQALASVADSAGAVIPFLTTHKKKAAEFLATAEGGKGVQEAHARAEAAELKAMELEDLIKAQAAEMAELKALIKSKAKE